MKSKKLLLLLLIAFFAPWAANAQSQLNEGFESTTFPPTDWATIHVSGANYWARYTTYKHSGDASAYAHWASSGHENYLITPKLVPASGESLSFFVSAQSYSGTTLYVKVSTTTADASAFSTTLATYTTGSSGTIGTTSPGTWVEKTIDLSSYIDQQIFIAFHVVDNNGGDVIIDDVTGVTIYEPACPKPTLSNTVATTSSTATITWTPSGASQTSFDIYWSTTNTAPDETTTPSASNQTGTSYQIHNLNAATTYYVWLRGNCGSDGYSDWTSAVSFTTPCVEVTSFPWSEDFNGLTVNYSIPSCWDNSEHTTTSNGNEWCYNTTTSGNGATNGTSHDGSKCVRFNSYSPSSGQYGCLKTPSMNLPASIEMQLSFWWKNPAGGDFYVYISTDGGSTYTTALTSSLKNQSTWKKEEIDLVGYSGTQNVVIVFKAISNCGYNDAYMYLDDVTVKEKPSCVHPTNLAEVANTATTNSVTFGWTAGNNETTWKVQYKKSGATDWTTVSNPVTQNHYTLSGLDASSVYQVRVAAWCTPSEPDGISEYCEPITVQTECDVVAALGYTENFDGYTVGNNVLPTCWNYINTTTYSSYAVYPRVYANSSYSTYANTAPNCLYFYSYYSSWSDYDPQPQYAILPEMSNMDGKQITLWAKGYTASSTLKVGRMTDPSDASTFSLIQELTLTTSYQEFSVELTGTGNYIALMIDAATSSRTSNGVYVDDIIVENAPTCKKPSALACNSKTAHTATLSWTNGAEGQNAWQIAYSTTADFDPNTVEPDDVTTNPATIEGLAQNTTYYAYVRANCGGGDYSAWCNNKVTFTTLAGNVTPSGLAVDPASITSSQATASWNAVAGNTLHEYYQIYWAGATVTSVPDEPAAPNLITNITPTSQLISGLNPETSYKVWVRDICGDDGNSAWSSAVTFTTAADCQLPDGLAESNVTTNSATITWNTYGQTSFNLQYSSDEGATWTTVPNVNSPYTFPNNLTANTAYQVQVQATCNTEEWSTVLSFRTECDAITITDSYSYTEDFEDPVTTSTYNSMTGLEVPYCWDNYTTNTSYAYARPHIIKESASYNYATSGQVLYFYGSGYGYAELPEFTNAINTLQISFKWATESNSNGSLTLGYITNEDNGTYNTFTAIGESFAACSESYHTLKSETVYLNNVPATATRLVFRWYYSSWYGANIDDIEVSLLPSCYPVGTLSAATDVTYNSAKLSWALVDNTQTEWEVQYATDENFTNIVDTKTATTNTNYELTGLTPETHYWVRVKAACSTTDDWSNAVDFTTDVFCAVTGLTAGTTTQTTADLSWTGASDSYNIQYRTAAVPTTTQLFTEGFETYADESALEAVWTVLDLGDGENTAELGLYDGAKKTGNYGFRFSSYDGSSSGDFDQYLISPELTKAGLLEFAYKSSNSTGDKFRVGYSSTTNDVSAFTWGAETNSASSWKTYSETMPEDAKYFAINYTAVYQFRLYIDDIAIYEVQDAGTWQNTTSETASKQLTGLAAGTKYDVQVQGVCGGTAGSWSTPIYSFTTLPFTKTIASYGTSANGGYYLIASPLAADVDPTTVGMITDDYGAEATPANSTYDFYRFDQEAALEWVNYRETAFNLVNGQGYLYASKNGTTLTFTGAPYSGTTKEVTLNKTNDSSADFPGWNLVGNPFPDTAYIDRPFYKMDESGARFLSQEQTAAIPPMEGVFVIADEDGDVVTFTKQVPGAKANIILNLTQGRGNTIDRAVISAGQGQALPKFMLNPYDTKMYIPQDGEDYAVVRSRVSDEIPVSFVPAENGLYNISVDVRNMNLRSLLLKDKVRNVTIDLLRTPTYQFKARVGDRADRFMLSFRISNSIFKEKIVKGANSEDFGFYSYGNWIIDNEGEATLQVIDLNGRVLSTENIYGSTSIQVDAAPGIYMLRLINGDNVKVQKVVVE